MRARIVRADGTTEAIELPGGDGNLHAMYKAMDCTLVDCVRIVEAGPGRLGLDMWIDDTIEWAENPPNIPATLIAGFLAGRPLAQYIAGTVLLTGGADSEGDTLGLSRMQDEILADLIAQASKQIPATA